MTIWDEVGRLLRQRRYRRRQRLEARAAAAGRHSRRREAPHTENHGVRPDKDGSR